MQKLCKGNIIRWYEYTVVYNKNVYTANSINYYYY